MVNFLLIIVHSTLMFTSQILQIFIKTTTHTKQIVLIAFYKKLSNIVFN